MLLLRVYRTKTFSVVHRVSGDALVSCVIRTAGSYYYITLGIACSVASPEDKPKSLLIQPV